MSRRQSRVPAEIDLDPWGKPTQIEAVRIADEIRGLRLFHFRRQALQPGIVRPLSQQANDCWIAGKGAVRESVDQQQRNSHAPPPLKNKQPLRTICDDPTILQKRLDQRKTRTMIQGSDDARNEESPKPQRTLP